jgi:hypothetical protein
MWTRRVLGVVSAVAFAGCAAHPLEVPTGSLLMKCATFAKPSAIFLTLTCASKEPDKRVRDE